MANTYYNFGGPFIPNTKVRSGQVNPEFEGVESGFDLLPSASDALTRGVVELGIDVQGGTVNEYDVGMPDTRLTNQEGDLVVFRATHTNDGAVVINVDTIGDIAAVEFDGSVFAGGEIVTGRVYEFRYDNANTQFVLSQSTDAANQAISAEDWAIRPEDDPVPVSSGGDGSTTFSALHWSAKSAAFGGGLDFFGDHDASSGDPASPATGNPLYRISVAGTITGAGAVEIGDDIYWNGVDWNRINNQGTVFVAGTSADDPTSPGTFDSNLEWQNVSGAPLANVGYNTDDVFALISRVHGGGLRLAGEASGGSVETYLTGNDGAGTTLHFAGLQKFATALAGVIINDSTTNDPTAGLGQSALINLRNGSFAPVADFGFLAAATTLRVKNFVHGGPLSLLGEASAGAEVTFAVFDPSSTGNRIFHNSTQPGFRVIQTTNLGIDVYNDSASATARTSLGLVHAFTDEYMLNIEGDPVTNVVEMLVGTDRRARLDIYATDTALNQVLMADFDAQAGPVRLYHSDAAGTTEIALSTTALGADVRAPSGIVPTLTLTEASTVLATLNHEIIASGTDNLVLRNEADSGFIELRGRNSASGDALMADFDPDGSSRLYWDENLQLRTASIGLEIIGRGAASAAVRYFASNGTTLIGLMSFGSTVSFQSNPNATNDGANWQFQGVDAGGVGRIMQIMDPDAGVALHVLGVRGFLTRTNDVQIIPTVTANLAKLQLTGLLGTPVQANIGFDGGTALEIRNLVDGGAIEIRGDTGAGAETLLGVFDADTGFQLNHTDGLIRARSATTGIFVRGDGAASASLFLEGSGGVLVAQIDVGAVFDIYNLVDGINMQIRGNDAGTVIRTMIDMDPDNDLDIYHPSAGTVNIRTVVAASGGATVNNALTGAGLERVLTASDGIATATTTELADITDAINTGARKVAGFEVFNTTTSIVVWAVGAADGSLWLNATGATAHTPV